MEASFHDICVCYYCISLSENLAADQDYELVIEQVVGFRIISFAFSTTSFITQ